MHSNLFQCQPSCPTFNTQFQDLSFVSSTYLKLCTVGITVQCGGGANKISHRKTRKGGNIPAELHRVAVLCGHVLHRLMDKCITGAKSRLGMVCTFIFLADIQILRHIKDLFSNIFPSAKRKPSLDVYV